MQQRGYEVLGDARNVLVETFTVNDALNQLILEHLDKRAWRAKPPGRNARTIAAIFSHVHNMRRKWLRLSAPHLKLPPELNRTCCTQKQASAALAESGKRCAEMIAEGLAGDERVKQFLRDGWGKPWPAGPTMAVYMITHEAHHRGQVCILAHQLGFPLPVLVGAGMWNWEKLWKQCRFTHPR